MLVGTPLLMAGTVFWAVIPDLPRLLGMQDLYFKMSLDPRCNIFLWHYSIDRVEKDSPWFLAGVLVIMVSMLAATWRELRIAEEANK